MSTFRSTKDGSCAGALASAIDEARRLYGSETSDAWFAALTDGTHPLCRVLMEGAGAPRPRITEADLVTDPVMLAAAERYAGDATHDREIADLHAGRHPLQSGSSLVR